MEKLQNTKCALEYRIEGKEIFGMDLTDTMNDPAFYTKSRRGVGKAWEKIKSVWNDSMSMNDVIFLLRDNNIKTHYWCMVD